MSHHQSYKLPKRNKFRIYRKLTIWILLVVSLVVGLIYWVNHDSLKINSVEIYGNKFVSETQVLNIYDEEMKGKHFFLFPRSNFLLVPKDKIEERIKKELLPVENAFVDVEGLHKVNLEIIEYKPVAIYNSNNETYFLNEDGILFIETPDFYVNDLVVFEDSLEPEEELLGKQYADPKTFNNLTEAYELLLEEGIKISKITTEDFETYFFRTVAGTDILIEGADKPEIIVDNLRAALSQESIHEIQFDNIDYFDLRFEDKVFYKLK